MLITVTVKKQRAAEAISVRQTLWQALYTYYLTKFSWSLQVRYYFYSVLLIKGWQRLSDLPQITKPVHFRSGGSDFKNIQDSKTLFRLQILHSFNLLRENGNVPLSKVKCNWSVPTKEGGLRVLGARAQNRSAPETHHRLKSVGNFVQEQGEGRKLKGWRGVQDSPSPTKDQAPYPFSTAFKCWGH